MKGVVSVSLFLLMAVVVDAHGQTATLRTPSEGEVITAIKSSMKEGDDEALATLKQKLSAAKADLPLCIHEANTECRVSMNGLVNFNGGFSVYKNIDECSSAERQACHDRITSDEADIAKFRYREGMYAFKVLKTTNYEGNVISYVDVRTKGTDDTERDKIVIQLIDNKWVMVHSEPVPDR